MEELLERLWPMWEILGLKGEGGSAVAMKGRYLLIWGISGCGFTQPLFSFVVR